MYFRFRACCAKAIEAPTEIPEYPLNSPLHGVIVHGL